jgi:hypothetical protein
VTQIMKFAVVRETTLVTVEEVQSWITATKEIADKYFTPAWDVTLEFEFIETGAVIPAGSVQVLILNDSDQAESLAYHYDTGPNGEPRIKTFVDTQLKDGSKPSVGFSHEVWETAADPNIDAVVTVTDNGVTRELAKEVADPCQDDSQAIDVNGVAVSAFVLPSYFIPGSQGPWSYPADRVNGPLDVAPGGYQSERETAPEPGQWTMQFGPGQMGKRAMNKAPTSRTMRRFNRPSA